MQIAQNDLCQQETTNPTIVAHQDMTVDGNFGLDAVANHNASTAAQDYDSFTNTKNIDVYHAGYGLAYRPEHTYVHSPPTPRSNTASEGIRTRSGRSSKRNDSPFNVSERMSNSPVARPKKAKKGKLDKSKTPKLTAPLSVLTKDMSIPLRDIEAWVNRPADERRKEAEKRNGYVTRPMNSFMLYRSAYAERTKQWCLQNNHQVVSSVSGESWPMEPEEVTNQFKKWAALERANHQAAHPEYKFSPSKSVSKRRKGGMSDDDDDDELPSDPDDDPDGEYREGHRSRRRKHDIRGNTHLHEPYNLDHNPYYRQQVSDYDPSHYQHTQTGYIDGSNMSLDHHGYPYTAQGNNLLPANTHLVSPYQYSHDMHNLRIPTPNSLNGMHSLGGYGLPSGHASTNDDMFAASRTATPLQSLTHTQPSPANQHIYLPYNQRQAAPQLLFPPATQYPLHGGYHPVSSSALSAAQLYEHRQYLQQAAQAQTAIDPALEAEFAAAATGVGPQHTSHSHMSPVGGHFEDALGEMSSAEMADLQEYYHQQQQFQSHAAHVEGAGGVLWPSTEG